MARFIFVVDDDTISRIDAYWHQEQFRSRSATMRALLTDALDRGLKRPRRPAKKKTARGRKAA